MDANEMFFKSQPIGWAKYGKFSQTLAGLFKTAAPSILVISLPRSGSSWVGEILGSARNALYLREPITQSHFAEGGKITLVDIDPNLHPVNYQHFGHLAFSGLPAFPGTVVIFPNQWGLTARKNKRLVIKEVNPLAFEWILPKYKPRIILLVRHPAAVALSWKRLGWIPTKEDLLYSTGRLLNGSLSRWKENIMSAANFWELQGALQGAVLRKALDCVANHDDARIIIYEKLCASYRDTFHELFRFSQLQWDNHIEELIAAKSSGDDSVNPYGTMRNSKKMPNAWKDKIPAAELDNLRKYFSAFNLPFYNNPEDW
ncbi:MAG: sulfotransferase domain-containing protein [Acidobacteria bacterium]|jgi:hypothetical protein|nr:sulfotransferase domain-containing protein [Acidobacteriota bacterium]